MRWHIVVVLVCSVAAVAVAGVGFCGVSAAAADASTESENVASAGIDVFSIGRDGAGSYEASLSSDVAKGTSVLRHGLVLPWRIGTHATTTMRGAAESTFVHDADGALIWDAALTGAGERTEAALFLRRSHRSSKDPFKLVHSSAYGDKTVAGVISRTGRWGGAVQYVTDVPLRRGRGVVVAGRLDLPMPTLSLSAVEYGSNTVRHRFLAVDGRAESGGMPLTWGVAHMSGIEIDTDSGPGLVDHTSIRDGAAFVRREWRRDAHSGWMRVHGTGPRFRSLAADAYPFVRGAFGVEGRWQWRLSGNRLLSVYGHRVQRWASPPEAGSAVDYETEAAFSSMPRGQWGWRLGAEGKTKDGAVDAFALEWTLTDGTRRFEWVTGPVGRDGAVTWRHKAQWDAETWRLRLLVDGRFQGWRVEWLVREAAGRRWTVVHKRRSQDAVAWTHIQFERTVPGLGDVWVRYMEPDRGRIDVGWSRSETVSAGLRVSF